MQPPAALRLALFVSSGILSGLSGGSVLLASAAERTLTDVAATPPMGWNSWNHYHCAVNEAILRNMSKLYQTTGVAAAGYQYVNIDDCWQAQFRSTAGHLQAATNVFPSGIKSLCDSIHADGNKFGIYVDAGYRTCQDRPGTLDNELTDAATFAEWGVDYVKNDACYPQTPNIKGGGINQNVEGVGYLLYERFFQALKQQSRPMFFSIENPPLVAPKDARNVSNARRVGGDIGDSFGATLGEFHEAPNISETRADVEGGPGFFNDLDMLEIGNGNQNKTEYTTQFSLWCIAKAVLLLGCDLSNPMVRNGTAADAFEIFLNKEVIAISQDTLAMPASQIIWAGEAEVWAGPLAHGGQVLLFLNSGGTDLKDLSFPMSLLEDFDVSDEAVTEVTCRDLWLHGPCSGGDTVSLSGNITVDVAVHGVVMMRLTPKTTDGAALAAAAVHEISAEDAVASAAFAASEAFTYHAALNPPGLRKRQKPKRAAATHQNRGAIGAVSGAAPAEALTAAAAAPNDQQHGDVGGVPVWSMRGGDATHASRSPFKGPSTCPTVAWTAPLGQGNRSYVWTESSPAVDGNNRLFVGSGSSLWGLSLTDGSVLWQFDTKSIESLNGQASEFFSSPALYNGLVLAGTGAGTMYACHADNGTVAWSFVTGDVVLGTRGGTGKAPITGSTVISGGVAYFGAWDGIVYAVDPATGAIKWQYQAMDVDSKTTAQIRATPAVSSDGRVVHFPAGRALYALDATTGKEQWVLQTNQVMYTSPTIAPDGTVIYGASGGGIARAVSSVGKQLWELDLGLFASTMGAITHDGNHVLLANSSGLCKVEIATGSAVWTSDHESRIASAGIAVDSTGVAFVPNGHGISYTKSDGSNTTNCDLLDPSGSGYNNMIQLTIAGDGMILQLSIHGMMKALVG